MVALIRSLASLGVTDRPITYWLSDTLELTLEISPSLTLALVATGVLVAFFLFLTKRLEHGSHTPPSLVLTQLVLSFLELGAWTGVAWHSAHSP